MNKPAYKKMPVDELSFSKIEISEDMITGHLSDGRIVSVPIAWFPRLVSASKEQLENYEVSPSGYGVHWPDVDEDISVKAFVGG
jgi:hypothetical protein